MGGESDFMGISQKEFAHSQCFIPPMLLTSLIHYAEQQQWPYAHWFQDISLDLEQLRQGQGFVSFENICHVIQHALHDTPHKHLGLLLGSHEGQTSMGILGFAMQACKTVAEALQVALHYHPISGSVLDLNVLIQDDYCEVEICERQPCHTLDAFFCDEVIASMMTCLQMMLGQQAQAICLHLNYDHSNYIDDYQSIFNCPIYFNAPRNIIRFDSAILSLPLKGYSPANFQTAIQICDLALQDYQHRNEKNTVQLLQHLIESHLPARFDMTQAAQHFQLSERHLRRLLLNEGLSFQHIRQNVLTHKACHLLKQNHSISEISYLLGFSELREFRRAFKRWTGASPSVYKKLNA